jgi:hypothetical protein
VPSSAVREAFAPGPASAKAAGRAANASAKTKRQAKRLRVRVTTVESFKCAPGRSSASLAQALLKTRMRLSVRQHSRLRKRNPVLERKPECRSRNATRKGKRCR